MDWDELCARTAEVLRSHASELSAAWIFGSVARGTHRSGSDLDVALLYRTAPTPTLAGLGFDIAHELELAVSRAVDVVVLNTSSADLIHRVLRDGVLVLESDRGARVAFEVNARAQYFDLAPLRARMRSARKGTHP
jgi:uncharacterized protein